jgi:hypothetical protein
MVTKEFKQFTYSLIAPAILVAIACLQLYLAHVHHLTPWKGGGFGMFSTVDSRGARFLRLYLTTAEGDVPVEVPPSMQPLARELRSIPTRDHLLRFAQQLAGATWVPYDYATFEATLHSSDQPALMVSDENDLTPGNSTTVPNDQPTDEMNSAPASRNQPRFRVKEVYEPDPESGDIVQFSTVRVELWRYTFDSRNRQVKAYKFLETTVERPQ